MSLHSSPTQRRAVKRHLFGLLGSLCLSAAVLAVLWHHTEIRFDTFVAQWNEANKSILIALFVLSATFHIFVGAHKLWCVLRSLSLNIKYIEALCIRLGVGPLRVLVPLDAGEFLNVFYLWRHKGMPVGRATGAAAFDRGLNMLGSFFWLFLGLGILPQAWPSSWSAWRLPAAGLAIIIYFVGFFCTPLHDFTVTFAARIHPKMGRFLGGILAPFKEFDWKRKLFFSGYALLFQTRPLLVYWFLFKAYGISMALSKVVAYGSLAVVGAHLPGFVIGLGPREAFTVSLFKGQAPDEVLLGVGILLTLSVHLIPMLLGLPWMMWFLRRLKGQGQSQGSAEGSQ